MSDRERAKDIAAGIAFEREGIDGWWTDAHTCLAYGCCGCGKDIDRAELARLIEVALLGFAEARIRELEQERDLVKHDLDNAISGRACLLCAGPLIVTDKGVQCEDCLRDDQERMDAKARIRELEAELASRVIR